MASFWHLQSMEREPVPTSHILKYRILSHSQSRINDILHMDVVKIHIMHTKRDLCKRCILKYIHRNVTLPEISKTGMDYACLNLPSTCRNIQIQQFGKSRGRRLFLQSLVRTTNISIRLRTESLKLNDVVPGISVKIPGNVLGSVGENRDPK